MEMFSTANDNAQFWTCKMAGDEDDLNYSGQPEWNLCGTDGGSCKESETKF